MQTIKKIIIPEGIFNYKEMEKSSNYSYTKSKWLVIENDYVAVTNTKSLLTIKQENELNGNKRIAFTFNKLLQIRKEIGIKGDLIINKIEKQKDEPAFKYSVNTCFSENIYYQEIGAAFDFKKLMNDYSNFKIVLKNLSSDFLIASKLNGYKLFECKDSVFSLKLPSYKIPIVEQKVDCKENFIQCFTNDFLRHGLDIKKKFDLALNGENDAAAITQDNKFMLYLPIIR